MSGLMITGASGFLGKALVRAARSRGHTVTAAVRGPAPSDWAGDEGIRVVRADLGMADAPDVLGPSLQGITAIIHAAASFAGDAASHDRDTIGATRNLLKALTSVGARPRFVLVSSLSVYDVAGMTNGATLTEDAPLVEQAEQRDTYAAAKVAQERLLAGYDGPRQIVRPGAIFGPDRLWSAQLGFAKAGRVFCPGPADVMPAIEVMRAADALVRAVEGSDSHTVNLIEPGCPTRKQWLDAIGMPCIPVPTSLVQWVGRMTGRGPAWRARFRPLTYDTTRASDLLGGPSDLSVAEQIARAKQAEQEPS